MANHLRMSILIAVKEIFTFIVETMKGKICLKYNYTKQQTKCSTGNKKKKYNIKRNNNKRTNNSNYSCDKNEYFGFVFISKHN